MVNSRVAAIVKVMPDREAGIAAQEAAPLTVDNVFSFNGDATVWAGRCAGSMRSKYGGRLQG